jgi:hypothetical protein
VGLRWPRWSNLCPSHTWWLGNTWSGMMQASAWSGKSFGFFLRAISREYCIHRGVSLTDRKLCLTPCQKRYTTQRSTYP